MNLELPKVFCPSGKPRQGNWVASQLPKLSSQSLVGQSWPHLGSRMHVKVPHALEKKANKIGAWVCGFFVVGCLCTPFHILVLCRVNGPAIRQVCRQSKWFLKLGLPEVFAPLVKLEQGIGWPASCPN